jgi:transcription elongation factor GreB
MSDEDLDDGEIAAIPSGLNYLTPEGFDRLKKELNFLVSEDRPATVRAVSDAAAMGDRSENAEYIYGKRRLREIDRRIRFLTKRLENVEIVDPSKVDVSKVSFGTWIKIVDEDGKEQSYQIVGQDEIDPAQGRITFSSPLGRALLGKKVGDFFEVQRPKGVVEVQVLAISRSRITPKRV